MGGDTRSLKNEAGPGNAKWNGRPLPEEDQSAPQPEIVYYAVPAVLLAQMLNVLNQLPRGEVNALATQLEQCQRIGEK